ncbi:MAG: response regulator transcription factor [Planctomycetaceae bacterium]|nr:response regulator transcription factor [Planctomycetaceae bacterium]
MDEFLSAEARFDQDVVAVVASAVRHVNELMQIAAKSSKLQVAFVDTHITEDRSAFCQANGIEYLNQDCPLTELRSALVRKCLETSSSGIDQAKHQPSIATDNNIAAALQSPLLAALTPRELQVLRLVAQGYSVRECAEQLSISHSTVDNHKSRMMAKLNIHKSIELVYFAIRVGLVNIDDPLG